MAQRREIATVYLAGLVQGVALVTFPAASAVFNNPDSYALSSTEYGGLFVPQAIMAIAASLLAAGLMQRLGTKRIYLLGLVANLLSMSLLVTSWLVMRQHAVAYAVLLLATTCLGIGFGFTVPALNTLATAFFPRRSNGALLGLNALLGVGTALAPAFVALFVGLGIWWGLPLLVAGLLVGLLAISFTESLTDRESGKPARKAKRQLPARFWLFAAFVLLYGICETTNGNWASLYMTTRFGASTAVASLALALFWSMVTVGRVLFALLEKWFPAKLICRLLPFVIAAAFVATACASKTNSTLGLGSFALAGFGCSALLPLAISMGQKELATISASVAGGLIAFYQVGYGVAAFAVGPLQSWAGLTLSTVYGGAALIALVMAGFSFFLDRKSGAQ